MDKVTQLKAHLADIVHLQHAAALLEWDQQVNMPPGGAAARAEQLATLSRLVHEKFTAEATGRILEEAEADVVGMDIDHDDAALVRVVRHDYDLATRVPASLVEELARTTALAHETWTKAREAADFSQFEDALAHIVDLKRQQAEALGYEGHPYDALLDQYEPQMKTADVDTLFDELRAELVPFVAQIFERLDAVDDAPAALRGGKTRGFRLTGAQAHRLRLPTWTTRSFGASFHHRVFHPRRAHHHAL